MTASQKQCHRNETSPGYKGTFSYQKNMHEGTEERIKFYIASRAQVPGSSETAKKNCR